MRILFITSNRIGDAVLTTGVLNWLESTYPEARFTIACGPVTADIFRATPRLDKLILLKKKKYHSHWIDLWKMCVTTHWDIVVDLRNSLVTRLLFAKKRYYKLPRASGRHKVVDHGSVMGLNPPPNPHIFIDAQTQAKANELVPTDKPILAMGPAANWAPKSWDIANFIEVAKRVVANNGLFPNAHLMIVAAPHERDQVQSLLNAFPKNQIIDLIGLDLLTVAACLKKASLFVGNDSGLMHLSCAVGTPTIGLFGPSNENIYGPWGAKTLAIRTPESMAELVAKQPYPGSSLPLLMGSLTVDRVMEGISHLHQTLANQKG